MTLTIPEKGRKKNKKASNAYPHKKPLKRAHKKSISPIILILGFSGVLCLAFGIIYSIIAVRDFFNPYTQDREDSRTVLEVTPDTATIQIAQIDTSFDNYLYCIVYDTEGNKYGVYQPYEYMYSYDHLECNKKLTNWSEAPWLYYAQCLGINDHSYTVTLTSDLTTTEAYKDFSALSWTTSGAELWRMQHYVPTGIPYITGITEVTDLKTGKTVPFSEINTHIYDKE